ncbi:MAG TPA: 2-oxoacid:acceptor oxidoreductase subunit alpha [bacterium]|nr:2-oxoacid:acceptor oxidoreductase subunit alpha [bacterium]
MIQKNRISIKFGGASGQGINSIGEIIAKAIKDSGYKLFAYREYPSLIRGGHASYQIDFSDNNIKSSSAKCDILVCIGRVSLHRYLQDINPGGSLIHILTGLKLSDEEQKYVEENKINIEFVDVRRIIEEKGWDLIVMNMVLVGLTWKLLGLKKEEIDEEVTEFFGKDNKYLELDLQALDIGYETKLEKVKPIDITFKKDQGWRDSLIISGNHSISLGAVSAGVRAYYAYPMTPASSILSYLASIYHDTGMLVKQAEDEITAIEMAIGSMFMGTRALVGTSGGGFDLMTESVSLSGMTETPMVCILAQRPGPATGIPTWTSASDLNLAIYSGHGEYSKCVIAVSDSESAYIQIQKAFNIAEKYQIPVVVLTEKQIAESLFNIKKLPDAVKIERHLETDDFDKLKSEDRFEITSTGISKRWLPGQSDAHFVANSDEHLEDGTLTEDSGPSKAMIAKRMKKMDTLLAELPEPELFGDKKPDVLFVGWGSVKNAVLDTFDILKHSDSKIKAAYLHYEYIYPLKTEKLLDTVNGVKKVVLVENNYQGQLGDLIRKETGYEFEEKLLKYDGRPFFVEDVLDYLGISNL